MSKPVLTVEIDASLWDAWQLLFVSGLRHLVVLDTDGTVGKAYGAKTTPHMIVIDKEGKVAYNGAIDSIPSADPADLAEATQYVPAALAAVADIRIAEGPSMVDRLNRERRATIGPTAEVDRASQLTSVCCHCARSAGSVAWPWQCWAVVVTSLSACA